MKLRFSILTVPWAAVLMLTVASSPPRLLGGPLEAEPQPTVEFEENEGPPLFEMEVDTSYTLGGETKFRSREFGDSGAFNLNLSASTFLQLGERWMMPLQLQSQNFTIDELAGVPMPDSINLLEFGTGLAYKPNDRWMFMAGFNAMLYKFDDIDSDDIGYSGGLMAEWQYSPTLKWVMGARYQPDNNTPLLPFIGFEWMINENWELDVTFPRPRLVYTPGDKWRFHAGMDLLLGTTFRTSKTLGSDLGLPEFDGVLGSYSDIRVGGGIGYQLSKSLSLEVEGGYSMSREVEYEDIDEKIEFDPAPYFRLGLRIEF